MTHIVAPNKSVSQYDIIAEQDRGKGNWPNGDLFNMPKLPYFKSRKAYKNEEPENSEAVVCYD